MRCQSTPTVLFGCRCCAPFLISLCVALLLICVCRWRYNPATDAFAWVHGSATSYNSPQGAYPWSGTPDGTFNATNIPYQRRQRSLATLPAAISDQESDSSTRAVSDRGLFPLARCVLVCSEFRLGGRFHCVAHVHHGRKLVLSGKQLWRHRQQSSVRAHAHACASGGE